MSSETIGWARAIEAARERESRDKAEREALAPIDARIEILERGTLLGVSIDGREVPMRRWARSNRCLALAWARREATK